MDVNSFVSFGWIFGVAGFLFGLYQWKRSSDEKVDREGQFKGTVNTKLDTIISDAKENKREHSEMMGRITLQDTKINEHDTRITVLEKKRPTRRTNQDE